mmetsp:Transcript_15414/g.33374  ORF Transcript_15414/g.33374 Transcript_15414/m.33374 type:complete len:660 (-) Transcript_15414:52-2031(-)
MDDLALAAWSLDGLKQCLDSLAAKPNAAAATRAAPIAARVAELQRQVAQQACGLGSPEDGPEPLQDSLAQVASSCLNLPGLLDDDEYSVSSWGLNPLLSQTIVLALAALASGLALRKEGCVPSPFLEGVGEDLDLIAVHIYGGLCRLSGNEADETHGPAIQAMKGICVWACAIIHNLVTGNHSHLTASHLWDWASGNALWAVVLAKGVLTFHPLTDGVQLSTLVPPPPSNLQDLKISMFQTLPGLLSADIAFIEEVKAGYLEYDCPIAHRNVQLAIHRAQLTVAILDCDLLKAVLDCPPTSMEFEHDHSTAATTTTTAAAAVPSSPSCPSSSYPSSSSSSAWLPSLARMVAELLGLPSSAATAEDWAEVYSLLQEECTGHELFSLSDALGVRDAWAAEVGLRAASLWRCLFHLKVAGISRSLLEDLAEISSVAVPDQHGAELFLEAVVAGHHEEWDVASVAAATVFASNAEVVPSTHVSFLYVLADLPAHKKDLVSSQLQRSTAVRSASVLHHWLAILGGQPSPPHDPLTSLHSAGFLKTDQRIPEVEEAEVAEAALEARLAKRSQKPRAEPLKLRKMFQNAPKDLCCALDGKLVIDPVRSPYGHLFERATLAEALRQHPGRCPLTDNALVLETCERDHVVRAAAVRWVRENGPRRAAA